MTFVGNSPIKFKNIKTISPLSSKQLANTLRQHHVYITASKNDPCSNALIEALSCGLPAIALNSGGHPELINKGGELFENEKDILAKIDQVTKNIDSYKNNLPHHNISSTANKYINFAQSIIKDRQNKVLSSKQTLNTNFLQALYLKSYYHLNSFVSAKFKNTN
jgi:glycosyltransferase involved in cell wall biosynthesis